MGATTYGRTLLLAAGCVAGALVLPGEAGASFPGMYPVLGPSSCAVAGTFFETVIAHSGQALLAALALASMVLSDGYESRPA